MIKTNQIPLSISAQREDLISRPPYFGGNKKVQNSKRNDLIQGFQNYLSQKKQKVNGSSSEKCLKNPFSYFKVNNQTSLIVHLPVNEAVSFRGYIKVTIIFGSVSIFGHNLDINSQNKSIKLFGSKEFKTYPFKAQPHREGEYSHLKDTFIHLIPLSERDVTTLMSSINLNDSILLIEELSYPSVFCAKQYINSNVKLLNFGLDVVNGDDNSINKESPEWNSLQLGKRNIIIGGEGTGKSTLAKYLINRLLNTNNTVLFLELDIGQGEFTPPGCVALIQVRQPILGPNFTHLIKPERMIHLGEVDSVKCSSEYLASVEILVQDIYRNFPGLPLVVNTMGFCKGLGLHLIIRTIATLKPSTVIQLNSEIKKKNFEKQLKPEVVNKLSKNRLNYNFSLIQSVSGGSKSFGSKREARERMLISYFSSVLVPPYYSFNTAEPFCIPFGDVSIGVTCNIAVRDVLSALNGCLIALCEKPAADATILKADEPDWFSIILKPSVQHCLGLGLVRGIDMEKRLIYIVTPVNIDKLQKVGLLQMSHVEVPAVVFTKQEGVDGLVPYVTKTTQDLSLVTVKRVFRQSSFTQPQPFDNVLNKSENSTFQ